MLASALTLLTSFSSIDKNLTPTAFSLAHENSLLKTVFFYQLETRKSKDWATKVIKDLNKLM